MIRSYACMLLAVAIAAAIDKECAAQPPRASGGTKFVFPKDLVDALEIEEIREGDECFFTCSEHPDYPLGKPFGPYPSDADCVDAMYSHTEATGHTDMVKWSRLTAVTQPELKARAEATSRCFCVGDCVKNSGDSSHFRRSIDVDCTLSDDEKKKRLLSDMVRHYLDAGHVSDLSNLDKVFEDMRQNIRIRCYTVSASGVYNTKSPLPARPDRTAVTLGRHAGSTGGNAERALRHRVQIYAGPSVFGPWSTVASHIGRVSFSISVEPVADTVVVGEVRYYNSRGIQVTEGFYRSTTISTGDSVGSVEVRLKGTPFGASCWVDIN